MRPLAKHPLYFDDLFVNLVEAGEQAGALESLLDKVATYKEKTEALKKKVKKALFYPAAVLVVALIVTVVLLVFVIPQFESLYKGFGANLPAFNLFVIHISNVVQHDGFYMTVVLGGRIFAFGYFKKRCGHARVLDPMLRNSHYRPHPQQGGNSVTRVRSPLRSPPTSRWSGSLDSAAGATGNIVYDARKRCATRWQPTAVAARDGTDGLFPTWSTR
jgi:type IV pilus assembly protein PilC